MEVFLIKFGNRRSLEQRKKPTMAIINRRPRLELFFSSLRMKVNMLQILQSSDQQDWIWSMRSPWNINLLCPSSFAFCTTSFHHVPKNVELIDYALHRTGIWMVVSLFIPTNAWLIHGLVLCRCLLEKTPCTPSGTRFLGLFLGGDKCRLIVDLTDCRLLTSERNDTVCFVDSL